MRLNAVVFVALLAACALVVVLGYQNRQLHQQQVETYERSLKPPVGSWLPRLESNDLHGAEVLLGGAERAQVIYFFDPGCRFCEASVPALQHLQSSLGSEFPGVSLVGVGGGSREALLRYLERKDFTFPTLQQSRKIAQLFGVRQVPLLLAVDHDGKVLYSHVGEIRNKDDTATLLTALRDMDG